MSLSGKACQVAQNLPQLQNLMKRDPEGYTEELQRHLLIYQATLNIFQQDPSVFSRDLHDLTLFLAQVKDDLSYDYLKHLK